MTSAQQSLSFYAAYVANQTIIDAAINDAIIQSASKMKNVELQKLFSLNYQ